MAKDSKPVKMDDDDLDAVQGGGFSADLDASKFGSINPKLTAAAAGGRAGKRATTTTGAGVRVPGLRVPGLRVPGIRVAKT